MPPFDARAVHPLDWVTLAAGALALVCSLFDYYRWYVPGARDFRGSLDRMPVRGYRVEISAWHGFFGWAAVLLALAGAAAVAVELIAPQLSLVSLRGVGVVAFALATVSVVLARFVGDFVGPRTRALGIGTDRGVGWWVSLVAIAVGAVTSAVRWWSARPAGAAGPGR